MPKGKQVAKKSESKAPSKANNSKAKKKDAAAEGGVKKTQRRWRPGTVALREIKKYQKTGNLLMPRAPFMRKVRTIANMYGEELRFKPDSLEALQEAAESFLTSLFEDA